MCAHVFWRAACVQALVRVLPSFPLLPFSTPFLSLLLPSSCLPSHLLPSPPLPSPPHPRLPYPENVLEERYVHLNIQCNVLAQAMPLHSRTCAHARVRTPSPHASYAAVHSYTLLYMLSCRGLRVRPRTIAHTHAIYTHANSQAQAHAHKYTHARETLDLGNNRESTCLADCQCVRCSLVLSSQFLDSPQYSTPPLSTHRSGKPGK